MLALALTGPTASGKTALSIALAKELRAEIISCDSMQIYRGMDIGTAKATERERAEAVHHMIDILSPREPYSAQSYREDALECAREITSRGVLPIFVGGTGLYIDTVMRGVSDKAPESSPEYRARLLAIAEREGGAYELWKRLSEIDPESAKTIHQNNVKRVIRALEIFDATGIPKSQIDKETKSISSDIDVAMITLDFHNRENLYSRVDRRVDAMIDEGLLDEVKGLYSAGLLPESSTASQAIGYKELLSYISGECELSDAVERLKLSSRRYAKRQLTWFRHERDAVRVYVDYEDGTMKDFSALSEEVISAARELIREHSPEGKGRQ